MDINKEEGISKTQDDFTSHQLERGLEDYLECERLLTIFFVGVNYCIPECLSQKVGKYRERMDMPGDPTQFPGNMGCCPYDEFKHSNYESIADRTLLERRRIEKYGEPDDNSAVCGYHAKDGCILKDHKSPICLAYVCPEFADFVHERYGIRYCKDKIEENLELILSNRQSPEEVQRFKDLIQEFTDKIHT